MEYTPLFVTLMGIGTVFFGLICIIFLTSAMGGLLKSNAKPAPAVAAAAPVAAAPTAPVVNTAKQQEVIAAITAALTEELGPNARNAKILDIKKI